MFTIEHRSPQDAVAEALAELAVEDVMQRKLASALQPLKLHHTPTYEHCLRVGLLAGKIGEATGRNQQDLLIAGMVHDCGKAQTPHCILECTHGWNNVYRTIMRMHVRDGYDMLLGQLDWAAAIMVWHHRFQPDPYPVIMPKPPAGFTAEQLAQAKDLGHMIAIADTYDACHRVNDRTGERRLAEDEIRQRMLLMHAGEENLINFLYAEGVFTY
jgi:putative nucleotidyltransferase with HDIG domain